MLSSPPLQKIELCRCLYKLHFQLLLLFETYTKMVGILTSSAQGTSVSSFHSRIILASSYALYHSWVPSQIKGLEKPRKVYSIWHRPHLLSEPLFPKLEVSYYFEINNHVILKQIENKFSVFRWATCRRRSVVFVRSCRGRCPSRTRICRRSSWTRTRSRAGTWSSNWYSTWRATSPPRPYSYSGLLGKDCL